MALPGSTALGRADRAVGGFWLWGGPFGGRGLPLRRWRWLRAGRWGGRLELADGCVQGYGECGFAADEIGPG